MFCHECGKEIPDGAKFCNFCGAAMPEAGPRHARPEADTELLYSFSDKSIPQVPDIDEPDPLDRTKVYENLDETKVYNFEELERRAPESEDHLKKAPDDREMIGDSYENYQDGEDDDTFMDKLDNRFRRDEDNRDRRPQKKNKTWLWITLGVLAAVLVIVLAILGFSGKLFGSSKKTLPTVKPTVAATVKPTQKPNPTQAPRPTQAPAPTEAPKPATEAPKPVTEAPPITEAPKPVTEPPARPTDPPVQPTNPPETPTEQPQGTEA